MEQPKLRKVERHRYQRPDESLVVLRDPLDVAETIAIDAAFVDVLDLMDGSRSVAQIRQSLRLRKSIDVPLADLESFVHDLSQAGWLDNERFRERWSEALDSFLTDDPRAPRWGDVLYPGLTDPLLAELAAALPEPARRTHAASAVAAVLVPHSPLDLTAQVAASTLVDLPEPSALDLVVVLGSDLGPGILPYALTAKRFETPLGISRVDARAAAALEGELPWVTREEIRHRAAASIELSVLLLQHVYGAGCPPLLPVLCGRAVLGAPASELVGFARALRSACAGRRVLWWCSAELGHAGPAYGRPELNAAEETEVRLRDLGCLRALGSRDLVALTTLCTAELRQGPPSGGPALITLAHVLSPTATLVDQHYAWVAAPTDQAGALGLAGLRFEAPA